MESIDYIKQFPLLSFDKGDVLLSRGEVSDRLLIIKQGFIKVGSVNNDGSERLLWIAGSYDMVPTEQLFSFRGALQFFYIALSDGSVYIIKKSTFLTHAYNTPKLMHEIAQSMSQNYDDLLMRVDSIDQSHARDKLIGTLLYLGRRFSSASDVNLCQVGLRLTHTDFSSMVGTTRETISVELKRLMNERVISYNRNDFMLHMDKLAYLFDLTT